MDFQFNPEAARTALAQLPVLAAQMDLEPPDLGRVYVPFQHTKALLLDASVVVGIRGAGKSWWTAVLASERHREFVSRQLQGLSLSHVTARVAFGLGSSEIDFPNVDTFKGLLGDGFDPVDIWKTIALQQAHAAAGESKGDDRTWAARVAWVVDNPREANRQLTACDDALRQQGRVLLLLFDAFDSFGPDWDVVRKVTRSALQFGLQLRSRHSIRAKFFIRPDLDEDQEIWTFPDSSKLLHAKVDLVWTGADLYGLLFMHLGNSMCFGSEFRAVTAGYDGSQWSKSEDVHLPPRALSRDRGLQQEVVDGLADRFMGGNRKRGVTYTWIPLHLADAAGRISPRSYLLAFKQAAEHTEEHYSGHQRALHYISIQQGVVKASEVRVQEIREDYPWVQPLLEAARGATVPITVDELAARWSDGDCLGRVKKAASKKLPPRRFTKDPFRRGSELALVDDLVELAVLYRTKDGRLNIPDIFRVGFGIRRKGGVRPPR